MRTVLRAAALLAASLALAVCGRAAGAFDPANPGAGAGYRIANVQNGLCWDARGGAFQNGTAVQQCACHEGDSQLWIFSPSGPENRRYYAIRSAKHPEICVVRDSAGQLELTVCDPSQPLQREARFVPELAMAITNFAQQIARPDGGDCAAVPNDSFENAQQLRVEKCDGSLRQAWLLLPWRGVQNDAEVAAAQASACNPE
jgi:hypothetical protein